MALSTRNAIIASCVLLAVYNLVGNLLLPAPLYVPANVGVAVVLLALAMKSGAGTDDIALRSDRISAGLKVGALAALAMIVVVGVAAAVPATREFFEDERAADMSMGLLLYHLLIRIPVGTALFEEVAFRGVLYGLTRRLWPHRQAAFFSAILFGLWHIVPMLSVIDANARVNDAFGSGLTLVGGVAGAFGVGLALTWLRERADSLAAPILAHAATNSSALLLAHLLM